MKTQFRSKPSTLKFDNFDLFVFNRSLTKAAVRAKPDYIRDDWMDGENFHLKQPSSNSFPSYLCNVA